MRRLARNGRRWLLVPEDWDEKDPNTMALVVDHDARRITELPVSSALGRGYWEEGGGRVSSLPAYPKISWTWPLTSI
jgi:hypothetical protein